MTLVGIAPAASLLGYARLSARVRLVGALFMIAQLAWPASSRAQAPAEAQQPMKFVWVKEGPAEACGRDCRE